jgi:sulfur carrier protein
MKLMLNGEQTRVVDGLTVAQLLQHLSVAPEGVAVEVNLAVLKRAHHATTILQEGDQVEIVQMIGGGSPAAGGDGA